MSNTGYIISLSDSKNNGNSSNDSYAALLCYINIKTI